MRRQWPAPTIKKRLEAFMGGHLVFYDGECGLCDHAVQFVLQHDTQKLFNFAPLQGSTAKDKLQHFPPEMKNNDSVILIENYHSSNPKIYILGKAAFRICWLLGGLWSIPGLISFLPSFFYDWGYRLVAKNRHRFFKDSRCVIPTQEEKHRFLP